MRCDTVVIFSDFSASKLVCLLVVAFFGGQRLRAYARTNKVRLSSVAIMSLQRRYD